MSCPNEDERLSFSVEWYDANACLVRKYLFHFYERDATVEMYDMKCGRSFLRRSKVENISVCDLFLGSTLNILGRQLTLVDYANDFTRKRLSFKSERTLCLIKPDGMPHIGRILDAIWQCGFQITKMKMTRLDRTEAAEFYSDHNCDSGYNDMVLSVIAGPILVCELQAENAIQRWIDLLGPTDSSTARSGCPMSIRARFGTDCIQNAAHGPATAAAAVRELEFMFPSSGPARRNTACYMDSTCAIIKPHTVRDGVAGDIIDKICECGFEIAAIYLCSLDKANAEEFLEIYKGVVQEYPLMVTELCSGPCIALEIRAKDAVRTFREFVGPADPEIARHLRPRSLRALFGRTKAQNSVHCTDLPEDGQLEVEYFFKILDQ